VEVLLLSISSPIMGLFIVIEMLYSALFKKKLYEGRDTAVSLLCTSLNFINDLAFRVVTLSVLTWIFDSGLQMFADRGVEYWIMLFLAQDFAYYVLHCADHYCRIFWAMHVTHHSSEKFNLAVAIRSSVFQPYYRVLFFMPLALIGFRALDIVFMYAATQVYGFWVHTETIGKLPKWFEFIFVTPSHHRVHHASNVEYLDSNMGMVLIIWDRIFGTFKEELPGIKPRFGLTKNIHTYHPIKVVFHEWQSIMQDLKQSPNWKTAFNYLVKPPGWSHNGKSLTAKQMREQQLKKQSY
jgi:sterol desaturase/sphingolipid hydroxylase (fatty acid hydroxylase superfamily)